MGQDEMKDSPSYQAARVGEALAARPFYRAMMDRYQSLLVTLVLGQMYTYHMIPFVLAATSKASLNLLDAYHI